MKTTDSRYRRAAVLQALRVTLTISTTTHVMIIDRIINELSPLDFTCLLLNRVMKPVVGIVPLIGQTHVLDIYQTAELRNKTVCEDKEPSYSDPSSLLDQAVNLCIYFMLFCLFVCIFFWLVVYVVP